MPLLKRILIHVSAVGPLTVVLSTFLWAEVVPGYLLEAREREHAPQASPSVETNRVLIDVTNRALRDMRDELRELNDRIWWALIIAAGGSTVSVYDKGRYLAQRRRRRNRGGDDRKDNDEEEP